MLDILFINNVNKFSLSHEVNGTMLLATKLLQAGFETKILRYGEIETYEKDYPAFIRDITDRIIELSPKCVSFYCLWPFYHITLRILRELKQRDSSIITVLGGPQASATAYDTICRVPEVDFVSTGEGENTVVPFFSSVLRENSTNLETIPGLYYRKGSEICSNHIDLPLCDLNTLPQWDDRLLEEYIRNPEPDLTSENYLMPIDAGRGCPYSCTFCCSSYFWRRTYRLKSPERLIEDIQHYNKKFGIKSFWFSHDALTSNNALVSDLCDRILEEGLDIKWACAARVDCITEELLLKMQRAGMVQIQLGIETGSLRMQKLVNKNLNLDKARRMISFIQKHNIGLTLFFMYGFPEETEEDLNDTLELVFSMMDQGVRMVDLYFCQFNPQTAITEKYMDQLVFDPDIRILQYNMFGFEDELSTIKANKVLFPFLYHLKTPVRDQYQYMRFLAFFYREYPEVFQFLHRLYKGDNLKLYRDFYEHNRQFFDEGLDALVTRIHEQPAVLIENMLQDFDAACVKQAVSMMQYCADVNEVQSMPEGTSMQKVYNFSYIDFKLKQPLEKFTNAQSELLLTKTENSVAIKIVKIY